MKKLFVTMIALAAAVTAFAQFPAGLSVGAGYVSAKKTTKADNHSDSRSFGGFYVNADYNIAIGDTGFGVAPGVYVDLPIYKDELVGIDTKWKELNLGIPVMVNYAFPVADIIKIIPFAGPTVQFGISSKVIQEQGNQKHTIDAYDGDDAQKRLQLFIGGGVAVDIAEIVRVSLGYDAGLLNRSNDSDIKAKDSGFHIGVAYLF